MSVFVSNNYFSFHLKRDISNTPEYFTGKINKRIDDAVGPTPFVMILDLPVEVDNDTKKIDVWINKSYDELISELSSGKRMLCIRHDKLHENIVFGTASIGNYTKTKGFDIVFTANDTMFNSTSDDKLDRFMEITEPSTEGYQNDIFNGLDYAVRPIPPQDDYWAQYFFYPDNN